jgi:hypothetical protein
LASVFLPLLARACYGLFEGICGWKRLCGAWSCRARQMGIVLVGGAGYCFFFAYRRGLQPRTGARHPASWSTRCSSAARRWPGGAAGRPRRAATGGDGRRRAVVAAMASALGLLGVLQRGADPVLFLFYLYLFLFIVVVVILYHIVRSNFCPYFY